MLERQSRLRSAFVLAVLALLAACAPASPPPSAPAKPAATEPAAKPAAPAPAAPAAAPSPAPTSASQPKVAASPVQPAPAAPAAVASPVAKASEAPSKPMALPKPEATSVKIGHSALEPSQFPFKLAEDLGLYKKYGIDNVETSYFDGSGKALQAMVAGQIDVMINTGGIVLSTQTTDAPMIMVAMYQNKVADNLVSAESVKTPADLKGKSLGISQFGGDSHATALMALNALGFTEKDVTIQQIGGQSARIAALRANTVAAIPVDPTLEEQMKSQGFNILIRLADTPLELARSGVVVSQDWAKKAPNTVLAVTAANVEAQQLMFTQTDRAAELFAKWTQASDPKQAEQSLRDYLKFARRDLRWSKEAWEVQRDVLATQSPEIKDVDVTKAYTFEFLDKLKEFGVADAVGVPRS